MPTSQGRCCSGSLVRRGVNALCLGPENSGYHSFPLESVETAIRFLKEHGAFVVAPEDQRIKHDMRLAVP